MVARESYPGLILPDTEVGSVNNNKLPGGWIGYKEITAPQLSITAIVDIAGLVETVPVGPNRRIKITARTGAVLNSSGDGVGEITIYEGATQLQMERCSTGTTTKMGACAEVILTPDEGDHTYKVRFEQVAGAGTMTFGAAANRPAFLLIEDIGPAS